jgi:hypothetical protein
MSASSRFQAGVVGANKVGNSGVMVGIKRSGPMMPVGELEPLGIKSSQSVPVAKDGCRNPSIQVPLMTKN